MARGYFAIDDPGGWRGLDLVSTLVGLDARGCVGAGEIRSADAGRRAHLAEALGETASRIRIAASGSAWTEARRRAGALARDSHEFLFLYGARLRSEIALRPPAREIAVVMPEDGARSATGFLGAIEGLAHRLVLGRAHTLTAGRAPRRRSARPSRTHSVGWGVAMPETVEGEERDPRRIGLWTPPGAAAATRRILGAFRALAATDPELRLVVLAEAGRAPLAPWPDDLGLAGRIARRDLDGDLDSALGDLGQLWAHAGSDEGAAVEPDPRVVLAALARGCPVVVDHQTSLAAGIREIGGALMRDGAWPEQFAQAGRELLTNDELRSALRRAGPILVRERYGREAYLDRLADVLAKIVAESA